MRTTLFNCQSSIVNLQCSFDSHIYARGFPNEIMQHGFAKPPGFSARRHN